LAFWALSWLGFLSPAGAKVEDLDKWVARVADAAKAGHFAAGLEGGECQASIPLHIGAVVAEFLDGKPARICSNSMDPTARLRKPVTVVDLDRKRFDSIIPYLPAALVAPNLKAASTIVFTHCSKTQIGRYGYLFPQTAYRRDCEMLFVDQSGSSELQILGIRSFDAFPPAKISTRFYFSDIVADRPEFNMRSYIEFYAADAAKAGGR
jgi:hypothetical protein